MTKTFLAAISLIVMGGSSAWAVANGSGDTTEAWIGEEYDSRWNENRNDLLQLWQRHSYQPEHNTDCFPVGRVWYCPATNTLAERN